MYDYCRLPVCRVKYDLVREERSSGFIKQTDYINTSNNTAALWRLNRPKNWCLRVFSWTKCEVFVWHGGLICLTSMDPVLWLRMSGDLLWMVIGSDSGTARSVSSRERSSRLPGSVCFCPFWTNREEEEKIHNQLSAGQKHGGYVWMWFYLSCYLCRGGPEAEAGRCVLLLLDTFDTRTEVELYMEALLWGEVLQGEQQRCDNDTISSKQMFLHNVALHFYFLFKQVTKFTHQKLTQKMAAYDKNKSTKLYLIVVLIQHDDNLSHIVEFRDSTEVIHGTLPLLVLLLLSQTQTKTQVQLSPSSEKHSKRPVELVLGCLHRANLHSGKCWAGSGRDSHWWNINVSWRGAQETSLLESTCQQDTSVVSLQPVQTPRIMSFHLI